jgi:hypothetical protein
MESSSIIRYLFIIASIHLSFTKIIQVDENLPEVLFYQQSKIAAAGSPLPNTCIPYQFLAKITVYKKFALTSHPHPDTGQIYVEIPGQTDHP